MGESSKFPKSWTFENQILKYAGCLKTEQFQVYMPINYVLIIWKLINEAIVNSLIQHFEADFLWKVSLKILNSGLILKTFTYDFMEITNEIQNLMIFFCLFVLIL